VALFVPLLVWVVGRAIDISRGAELTLRAPAETLGAGGALLLPVLIISALPSTLGEEVGWRGFALPRLQARYGALGASLLLGLFWSFWHGPPLIAQQALALTPVALLGHAVGFVAIAILYTWLFNGTGQSLLLVWLYHASDAITQYVFPRLPTATDDLLVIGAAMVVVLSGALARGAGEPAVPQALPAGSGHS
jgi:membrane protease YdiL (CAAX protease family)